MKQTPLSKLIGKVQEGNSDAVDELASHFFDQALVIARQTLPKPPTPVVDHEDLALSALRSFCLRIRDGRIEYQGDKQLVALLKTIVGTKTKRLFEYHFAEKRDPRRKQSLTEADCNASATPPELHEQFDMQQFPVDPDDRSAVSRILESLQHELRDLFVALTNVLDEHPRRALFLMLEQDFDNREMARQLGRSVASVERYRQLIREKIRLLTD